MTAAIVGKTVGDRRRAVLGYSLGVVALAVWLGVLFPVIRDSSGFVDFMDNLPSGMMSAMGIEPATFLTAAGFLHSQLFSLFAPVLVLFFVISTATSEVTAEEREGLMDMLLSNPVSRTRVFVEKAAGVAVSTLVLVAFLTATLLVVNPIFDLALTAAGILGAGLSLWLLGCLFAAVALAAGAFTGRSVLAGGLAGFLAFGAWFVHSFADLFSVLGSFDQFSPFTWYQEPSPLVEGIGVGQLWLALAAGLVATLAGWLFGRRDLATERTVAPSVRMLSRPRPRRKRRSPRTGWLLSGAFRKTLWDRRRSVWAWGGGLGLLTLVMFSAWPALAADAEALTALITSLPREVFAMFGMSNPEAIVTPAGFISSRTYQTIGPIVIIMFVVRGVSTMMIKEETSGMLDQLVTISATRRQVVTHKTLGVFALTGLVVALFTVAALVGDLAWDTQLGSGSILAAGAGLGLLGLFFGGLTMAIWAWGGSSFPAVRITAVVAMATFLLNGLGSLTDFLEPTRVISPFYWYFGDTPPLAKGFQPTYWLLLAGALLGAWAAVGRIESRDLAT